MYDRLYNSCAGFINVCRVVRGRVGDVGGVSFFDGQGAVSERAASSSFVVWLLPRGALPFVRIDGVQHGGVRGARPHAVCVGSWWCGSVVWRVGDASSVLRGHVGGDVSDEPGCALGVVDASEGFADDVGARDGGVGCVLRVVFPRAGARVKCVGGRVRGSVQLDDVVSSGRASYASDGAACVCARGVVSGIVVAWFRGGGVARGVGERG